MVKKPKTVSLHTGIIDEVGDLQRRTGKNFTRIVSAALLEHVFGRTPPFEHVGVDGYQIEQVDFDKITFNWSEAVDLLEAGIIHIKQVPIAVADRAIARAKEALGRLTVSSRNKQEIGEINYVITEIQKYRENWIAGVHSRSLITSR